MFLVGTTSLWIKMYCFSTLVIQENTEGGSAQEDAGAETTKPSILP